MYWPSAISTPRPPTHKLIIPKKHIATINDLEQDDWALCGQILAVAKKLAKDYQFAEDGYRLIYNVNAGAGQTVYHIHCHLLGGRAFSWPPG